MKPTWRKSSYSTNTQNCVEIAASDSEIRLRDSKHPDHGHLTITRTEITAFIAGAKAGEFDDLA